MTIRIAIDLELHNDGPTKENPNPECGSIIQIGFCIFSTNRGILEVGGDYIKTGEPLSPYIRKLTHISERDIAERGVSLHEAYINMQNRFNYWVAKGKEKDEGAILQLIEWGNQDSDALQFELNDNCIVRYEGQELLPHQELVHFEEINSLLKKGNAPSIQYLKNNYKWTFGRSTLNLKAVYQMYQIANNNSYRGGLSKSLKSLGLEFQPYKEEVRPGVFKQRGKHSAFADSLNTALMYLKLEEGMK